MFERPMMPKQASLPDAINERRDLALRWQDAGFRVLPELEKHAGTIRNPLAPHLLEERARWCKGTKEAAAYTDLARCHDIVTPESLMEATWRLDQAIGITDAHYSQGMLDPIEIAWSHPLPDPATKRAGDTRLRVAAWAGGPGQRALVDAFGAGMAYKMASDPGAAIGDLSEGSIRLLSSRCGVPVDALYGLAATTPPPPPTKEAGISLPHSAMYALQGAGLGGAVGGGTALLSTAAQDVGRRYRGEGGMSLSEYGGNVARGAAGGALIGGAVRA